MRAIHEVRLDKVRPAVILTREVAVRAGRHVTVAPNTSTVRGLRIEVPVGPQNGLDHTSVINVDNLVTVPNEDVLEPIGYLTTAYSSASWQHCCTPSTSGQHRAVPVRRFVARTADGARV